MWPSPLSVPKRPWLLAWWTLSRRKGCPALGPSPAAQLEGSAYQGSFLARHGIPTADYAVFDALAPAEAYVRTQGAPNVIKADGLAAGKGVVVAMTEGEARLPSRRCWAAKGFWCSGGDRSVYGRRWPASSLWPMGKIFCLPDLPGS